MILFQILRVIMQVNVLGSEYGEVGISVVLCCYNSSARLSPTLKHLALQEFDNALEWEVVLVNNCSTDDTTAVAQREWEKYSSSAVGFHIFDELTPGLSHAREKGISSSRFQYIVFCDDDNWLGNRYLQTVFNLLTKNSKIAAVGGQSRVISDTDLPSWFETSKDHYAVGQQASHSCDISKRKYLWGSGLSFKKEIYRKAFFNFPSLLTGRRGEELTSGEDSEMCMRFLLMGYQLYYSDQLEFTHFIPRERLTTVYDAKLVEGFVKAYEVLKIYARFIDLVNLRLKERFMIVSKSLLKLIVLNFLQTNRWNPENEKLNIFIITGYPLGIINTDLVHMRKLIIPD